MVFQALTQITLLFSPLSHFFPVKADDITARVFGSYEPGIPAAFGDFNGDGWTDLFTIKQEGSGSSMEILLGSRSEPVLRPGEKLSCSFIKHRITSVIPGSFNSDVYMDVLVIAENGDGLTYVYLFVGEESKIKCADEEQFLLRAKSQPIAVDYNKDAVTDLFGEDEHGVRVFWQFNANNSRGILRIPLDLLGPSEPFRHVHSNAFIDLNQDGDADLYITSGNNSVEYWYRDLGSLNFTKYASERLVFPPVGGGVTVLGQTTFVDFQSTGELFQFIPICAETKDGGCKNSSIHLMRSVRGSKVEQLPVSFVEDSTNKTWSFAYNRSANYYLNGITLRVGDFNLDGYPDLLVTLSPEDDPAVTKTFLLENIECEIGSFLRTFKVSWNVSISSDNNIILGVFYDFFQDGSLHVLSVQSNHKVTALQTTESMDYDVSFLKVTVLPSKKHDHKPSSLLLKDRKIYGTNLPGPTIDCESENVDRRRVNVRYPQMPQSAYFSLSLPYVICGFGRLADYVEELTISFRGGEKSWDRMIPNANIIVIPGPRNNLDEWRLSLFIPRESILYLVAGLIGPCFILVVTVAFLHWRELKEDKKETLREPLRFSFHAI